MMLTIDYKYALGEVYIFLRYLITKAKVWCFALAFLFVFMPIVNAETLTYDVCKSGCEYSDLNALQDEINNISNVDDVVIDFLDNETYDASDITFRNYRIRSLSINGNGASIDANRLLMSFHELNIKDITISTPSLVIFGGVERNYSVEEINANKHLEHTINIQNVVFNESDSDEMTGFIFMLGTINIEKSIINSTLHFGTSDAYIENSNINKGLDGVVMIGGPSDLANIHVKANNVIDKNNIKRYLYTVDSLFSDTNAALKEIKKPGALSEMDIMSYEEFANQIIAAGYTNDFNTHIYFYQESSKSIKEDINISEFEKDFVDTYKDSEGYDDIKDLPIEWTSKDESIAKIDNNMVKVVNPGMVDLVGRKGNDFYTVHLTVVRPDSGIIEKVETETKNYANADFSSSDLNSIIPLTNEEQSLKESGKNVDVFLEVKDASETVAPEEKNLIEEKLSSNEEIGTYLDVSLFKQVEGEEASKIEKTNGNIRVSLNVPDDLINKDNKIKRTYYILRLHDGVVDKLETNFDGKVLTFETDRFSTYALTYKDEVISGVNNPKTGDNIIKYMGILFGSIMLIVFMLIEKINIKNKN